MSAIEGGTLKLANATVFTANKPSGNTAALDVVTCVQGRVVVVANRPSGCARVKRAVERFDLSGPELEVACGIITITREGNLWGSTRKHVQNFAVYGNRLGCETWRVVCGLTGDVAKLMVIEHRFAPFVAGHSFQIVLIIFVKGCCGRQSP